MDGLIRDGSLLRSGAGKRGSPFVYHLAAKAGGSDEMAEKVPVPTRTSIRDEKPNSPRTVIGGNGHLPPAEPEDDPMLRAAFEFGLVPPHAPVTDAPE